uniref:Uncharacterized protein n=1 Tax=Rhizophora mucronata TaxID=61149 RepID=A0A2P2P0P6_RHIMU
MDLMNRGICFHMRRRYWWWRTLRWPTNTSRRFFHFNVFITVRFIKLYV